MNLKAGFPFSLIKNGLPHEYPRLENDHRTEVVIIGGGISGALTAYYLVRAGISCTVVDARTIGLGSTCASTSLLQYEIDIPLHRLTELIGKQHAVTAYRHCEEAIFELYKISQATGFSEFSWKPSLLYAAKPSHQSALEKEFDARRNAGFDVSLLSMKELKRDFGLGATGAILSATGAIADAYLLTHSLLNYSIRKGLKVYDRTKINTVEHHRRGVRLTTDAGLTINAKSLVFATGYETMDYLPKKIVSLKSTYAVISESHSTTPAFGKHDVLIWNTDDPYLYMRTTSDKRILVGGRDVDFYSPVKRDRLITRKAKQLGRDFEKLFPGQEFLPEFSWTGTFGSTKDGLPYIGKYGNLSNTYFALGFGGNGITFSVIAAKIITAMLTGKKNRYGDLYSFTR